MDRNTRTEVILRHETGGNCPICKKRIHPLTIDHIYPKSRGGSNKAINLRVICKRCNSVKSDRIISDKYLKKMLEVNQK